MTVLISCLQLNNQMKNQKYLPPTLIEVEIKMSITGAVTVSRLTFRFFIYNKTCQKICWQYE